MQVGVHSAYTCLHATQHTPLSGTACTSLMGIQIPYSNGTFFAVNLNRAQHRDVYATIFLVVVNQWLVFQYNLLLSPISNSVAVV